MATTSITNSSSPTTPGQQVILKLGERLVYGEIIDTEPDPRFGALCRTRLTIRTEPQSTEITALARDVEAADDGPGPSAPLMDAPV